MNKTFRLVRFDVVLLGLALLGNLAAAGHADAPPELPALHITQVTLERVPGGPQPENLPPDTVVLRWASLSDHQEKASFNRLAQWLQTSQFFSRTSSGPLPPFLADAGFLLITVVRDGKTYHVLSNNGQYDDVLWQTEMAIRGTAASIETEQAQQASRDNYRKILQK